MTDSVNHHDRGSITAPGGKAIDVTVHASDDLPMVTRGIMVSTDGTIITGYLENDPNNLHVTFPLSAGVMYPMAFKRITILTSGTVKGYA